MAKTKAELMQELDEIKAELAAKTKEIENLEKYKKYKEMGDEMKAIHNGLMDAGFTNEQAFEMLKTMIPLAAKMAR